MNGQWATGATRHDGTGPEARDELARRFTELGLSLNEGRLYLALLRLEDPTASELAEEAGVPRPKVYSALAGLEAHGFCITVSAEVTRYRPVAPTLALGEWVRHRDHERAAHAEHERVLADELTRTLPAPAAAGGAPPPSYLEAVSGRARTSEAITALVGRAERSVRMLMQPPWIQPGAQRNVAELAALRRGVEVRVVYSAESLRDPSRYASLMRAGAQCRVLDQIPMKLLVRDEDEALVSLRDARSGEQTITSVAIRHPDLARPLGLLFEQEWEKASPIEEGAP